MPSIPFWGSKPTTPEAPVQDNSWTKIRAADSPNATGNSNAAESATAAANEANVQSVPVDHITPPPTETTNPTPALDAISDIVNNQSATEILSREEGIGYLSSLGLNFGWGPSSVMQWVIEHVHVWTGLGWAGSIVATAVVVRALMFYPTVKGTILTANMKKMSADPRHAEATEKLKAAVRNGDREMQQNAQALMKFLREEHKAPATGMLWNFLPVPFSFGMFRVVTGMTHIPVPSLETAGFAWFTDLTASDPYFLLPAIATAFMVFSIKVRLPSETI